MSKERVASPQKYQIKTVAKLTGLKEHSIRTWERRYNVVQPERTATDRRLYSEEDVHRLGLLAELTRRGHNIGALAKTSNEELESLLARDQKMEGGREKAKGNVPYRALVVGTHPHTIIRENLSHFEDFEVIASMDALQELEPDRSYPGLDLFIVYHSNLFPAEVTQLMELSERIAAQRTVVIYGYGRRDLVSALDSAGLTTIQGPVNAPELRLACLADLEPVDVSSSSEPFPTSDELIPEPAFADDQLSALAELSSTVQCECPRHLAKILLTLLEFERYSADCENQNAEDAELHSFLYGTTAKARASFERALQRVLEKEKLDL